MYRQGPDLSEFNPYLEKLHGFPFGIVRSNDGTYRDIHWHANLAACESKIARGEFAFWGAYFVWETNWLDTIQTFIDNLSRFDRPHLFVETDVESWGGKITGDHSKGINGANDAIREQFFRALPRVKRLAPGAWHRASRRVITYANMGDRQTLADRVTGNWNIANYDTNPHARNEILHQYTDRFNIPGFGLVDMNSADGVTTHELAAKLGVQTARHYKGE